MRWGAALVLVGWATSATAADKPVYAPPPAWVRPVAIPPAPAKDDGSAVQMLLLDQQVMLRQGQTTVYTDSAYRLASPQALGAGSISFPWRPDFDTLTIHRLVIHRGEQAIDVLKGQTFTVIRRETNLENAVLDGVLTANIQPEGLQVGDVLEIAASVTSADPTLGSHVEFAGANWNALPIERAHLRVSWPSTSAVRWRVTPLMGTATPVSAGGVTSVELSADHLPPAVLPRAAPGRFRVGRLAEFTDYAGWGDLAAMMAPLYVKAATIKPGSALAGELMTLKALPTPEARALGALALVQDRVRYVALAMGAGGLTPADAETSWSRRFGDCKGKTVLLLALLHGLGIEAEPVVVRAEGADGLDARLPMVGLFDHVLVRASIGGKTYWLDGTRRGDRDLALVRTPNTGWGLPLVAHDAALVRMRPTPLDRPQDDLAIRLDMRDGITEPVKAHAEQVLRGDLATMFADGLAQLAPDARDRTLRDYWRGKLDFITPDKVTATFDPKVGEEVLALDGTGKADWSHGGYETDSTVIGYHADFHRDPGPDRDAPFAVAYPYYSRVVETIQLPAGFSGRDDGTNNVDETIAGITYHRRTTLVPGTFSVEKTERSVGPEFPFAQVAAAESRLRTLGDNAVWLMRPPSYVPTAKEAAASPATGIGTGVPTDAAGFVARAQLALSQSRPVDAGLNADRALALDPKSTDALLVRAVTNAYAKRFTAATSDLAAAQAINPRAPGLQDARGMLAMMRGDEKTALDAYAQALQTNANDTFPLLGRASLYASRGDNALALADYDRALTINPRNPAALASRAILHGHMGDLAADEADLALAGSINPHAAPVIIARGDLLQRRGDFKGAVAAYTELVKPGPGQAGALADRARAYRALHDDEHALADLAAAIQISPANYQLYLTAANILRNQGKPDAAAAEVRAGAKANPTSYLAQLAAANMLTALGHRDEAKAVYDQALIASPHNAYVYVNRANNRERDDVAGRRADLDAALAIDPTMVEALTAKAALLRDGGDPSGAADLLSAAIAARPDDSWLLFHRGLAYAQAKHLAAAGADFAAARARLTEANDLNSQCWEMGTAGVALDAALADCQAALALAPGNAAYLDSRALVELKLGRLDAAIADYNDALAKAPRLTASLEGRSIAWARKGDAKKAAADATAARQIDAAVDKTFAGYGLTR